MNVDVVIVTYRSEAHLCACLDSVPEGTTVVVVDNASGDESPAIARAAGATVIENTANVGFAAAANQGSAQGTAPYVLFLNPDAQLEPGCLQSLVHALEEDPHAAIAGPRLRSPGGRDQRNHWPFPSPSRSWAEAFGLLRVVGDDGSSGFLVGACLLVRRSALEAASGFDEEFWLYGEEADLAFRLAQLGYACVCVPQATCTHIGGASGNGSVRAFEEFQLGTERFLRKHHGRTAVLSHRLALLIGSVLRVILLTLALQGSSPATRHRRRIARRLGRMFITQPLDVPSSPRVSTPLVLLSLEPWDEIWRRNQFLVRELLAADDELRVLFVEPPIDLPHHVLRMKTWLPRRGLRQSDYNDRLLLFTPTKILPRVLGPWADASLIRQLRRAMDHAGAAEATLWVNDPAYARVVRWGRPLLYDLTDDWTKADRPPRLLRRLKRWDRLLTRKADVVIACSPALLDSHSDASDVRLIPNAVDVEHFTTPQPRPADLPPSPVAVYVGTLHEDRLDVELVCDLAQELPVLNVVLVGPSALSASSTALLDQHRNVFRLGSRPYARVPSYLQHADVIIVPHVVSPFTDSLDPIKAYECVAVGRTTVSTPVAGFRDHGEIVTIAVREDFGAAIRDALATTARPPPSAPPTWRGRAAAFRVALDEARRTCSTRCPSVVYLDHCARLSGAELALARLLPSLQVNPHVILAEHGPLEGHLRSAGIGVEVLPMETQARDLHRAAVQPGRLPVQAVIATIRYMRDLAERLRELEPDLIHTNSLKSAIYGSLAARWVRVPVVVHVRDRIAPDYLPWPAVLGVRTLLRFVPNAVIANSHSTLTTLRLPNPRTAVVRSPVIHDAVLGANYPRPYCSTQRFTVVMVGRIAPWKGQDVFLRAFAQAFQGSAVRAVIVGAPLFGEGHFEEELRELVVVLRIAHQVEFTGFRLDVDGVLADADVLVHASTLPEPFGQVILEGMAAGVPVIAANAGGPSEIIENGVSGLLVNAGDVDALASALIQVQADPALRARLSRHGLERVKGFRPEVIAPTVDALYSSLVAKR